MNLKEFRKKLLSNPKFKKEFDNQNDLAFEISEMIINNRIKRGMTQEKLAKMVKTKQSSIARLESGKYLPSLSFLQKIAKILNADLIPPKILLKK